MNNNNRNNGYPVRLVSETFQPSLLTDIFSAYYKARANKRNTASQIRFERSLSSNLIKLYDEVTTRSYRPGRSMCFIIHDPVQREVFAAPFRDRIIHHYLYEKLEPIFEPTFIYDTYSCRKGKGTLFGIERLEHHIRSCSDNYHNDCFVLKLDIEGYFMKIDRSILFSMVMERIDRLRFAGRLPEGFDYETVAFLLEKVIFLDPTKGCRVKGSMSDWDKLPRSKSLFHSEPGCGLPIGNLTSQMFSNIYLNELDQYVKRDLGFRHYGRYVDDSYIVGESLEKLLSAVPFISDFLSSRLHLRLNANKIKLFPTCDGVPFLGAVIYPWGRYVMPKNLRRMKRRYDMAFSTANDKYQLRAVLNSYAGYLSHFSSPFRLLPFYEV